MIFIFFQLKMPSHFQAGRHIIIHDPQVRCQKIVPGPTGDKTLQLWGSSTSPAVFSKSIHYISLTFCLFFPLRPPPGTQTSHPLPFFVWQRFLLCRHYLPTSRSGIPLSPSLEAWWLLISIAYILGGIQNISFPLLKHVVKSPPNRDRLLHFVLQGRKMLHRPL